MVSGIRNYRRLFARIRYKMTSKKFANGRFRMGDLRPDRAVIPETGKRACFGDEGMTHVIPEWRRCRRQLRLFDRGFPPTGTDGDFRAAAGEFQTIPAGRPWQTEDRGILPCRFRPALSDGSTTFTSSAGGIIFMVWLQKMMNFVHRAYDS